MNASALPDPIGDVFLNILSHEIRTPITTICAGVRIVASGAYSDDDRRSVAEDVIAEAERLYRLVEDLLILGHLDRLTLRPEHQPVSISHIVFAAVAHADVPGRDPTVAVIGGGDIVAEEADAQLVGHVVRNLLDNAIRYSAHGDLVEVVVEAPRDEIRVRFLDRGLDPVTNEVDAFELMTDLPPASAQRAGAGIGVYVAGRLVRAMGGRVWARRRQGGGSEFGFALPKAAAA